MLKGEDRGRQLAAAKPTLKKKKKADAPNLRQTYLDLGQKSFAPSKCPQCGMVYTRGLESDERQHRIYHEAATKVPGAKGPNLKFPGWEGERVVMQWGAAAGGSFLEASASDATSTGSSPGKVIMVLDSDGAKKTKFCRDLVADVEQHAGLASSSSCGALPPGAFGSIKQDLSKGSNLSSSSAAAVSGGGGWRVQQQQAHIRVFLHVDSRKREVDGVLVIQDLLVADHCNDDDDGSGSGAKAGLPRGHGPGKPSEVSASAPAAAVEASPFPSESCLSRSRPEAAGDVPAEDRAGSHAGGGPPRGGGGGGPTFGIRILWEAEGCKGRHRERLLSAAQMHLVYGYVVPRDRLVFLQK